MMRLVDELGFDPVDAGSLEDSWRQQPGTPCYAADLDATRLKESLASAERSSVPEYRAQANDALRGCSRRSDRYSRTLRFADSVESV